MTGDKEIDAFLTTCFETMKAKGHEYTQGDVDRLKNFRETAKDLNLTMPQVWYTYFYKHLCAIKTYIRDGHVTSNETIASRIQDCIVYLLLLYRMTEERARAQIPPVPNPTKPEVVWSRGDL